ncbi:very short patch repair endonuclease [uncultured Hoeflea sp.]|uniref:very short patch repair endonuclease n=1 Tax=uncultured Hoeflea sp. TaxID=538666 RepID=UPI0030DCD551
MPDLADVVDKETRSRMMSGIRSKDTKPELLVRRVLHRAGYRYRLHAKDLPGKPDIILRKYKTVIFVHGCFWHHHDCKNFKWPKTREDFWRKKIDGNVARDRENYSKLGALDWRVIVIWECQIISADNIIEILSI